MYDLPKNLPLLTSLVAKGVVTTAVGGAAAPAAAGAAVAFSALEIAKAFAPDVTEHFVSVLDYARFKEFLIKAHPGDLNHDLDKLIKDALVRAVGFIKRLYLDKLNEEHELTLWQKFKQPFSAIEEVLSAMERDVKAKVTATAFQKAELETYLTGDHTNCFDELTQYLFTVSGVDEAHPEWQKLRTFFREQLPLLFDLSFKEALKDEGNSKAFKAFEIWILEEGLKHQKQLLDGQTKILLELEALKTGQPSASQAQILRQFDEDIQRIPLLFTEKLESVIAQLSRIEATVVRTEGKVDEANRGIQNIITILENGQLVQKLVPRQLTTIPAFGGEFIGRDEDVKQLRQTLQTSRKVVLMNGTGGIGKTTLAKWFVNYHLTDYDHVCWIEVTKQDTTVAGKLVSGSIKEALADNVLLFKNLGVSYNPKEETTDQRFEQITNALRNLEGHNLFVIDNAGSDAGEKAIRNVLPQPPHWQVLITSRQKLNGYEILPLDKLPAEAAETLFYMYYTHDCDAQNVKNLLESIDYHTLTVELFAKTLEAHHGTLSVPELLQRVQRKALSEPNLQRKIETEHHPAETEVFLHLMLAFDCADLTADEKALLSQLALLPPEPYSVPNQLAPWLGYTEVARQRVLDDTLTQLEKKGWLTQTNHSYSLHRLIQQVILYQIPFNWETTQVLVDSITKLLQTVDNPNALAVYPLRKYGEFLLANISSVYLETSDISRLNNNLALVYQALGWYVEAARLLEKAFKSDEINFEPNHPTVAVRQSNLAAVYRDLGRYVEAARLLEKALKSDETNFGPNHPTVARSQSNLATVYKDLGRYAEAASLLEKALHSDETNFGSNHPDVARSQSNLASVYQALSRYEEAANLLEKALKNIETHFDLKHPSVATIQSNLASVYQDLGRYMEAASLLEKALKSDETNFGLNHPNVAISQSNLATVYRDLGRYAEAARLMEEALHSDETNFGPNHVRMARSQSILALVYQNLGRYVEAADLLKKALKSDEINFGLDHPNLAKRQSNLATVYQNLGRYEEAASLLEKALHSDETNFGPDHHTVAIRQLNLATVLLDMGKSEDAIKLLQKAEAIFLLRLGENHPHTKSVRSWLAHAQNKD